MTVLLDEMWRTAACRAPGVDPDVFFGLGTELARSLCRRCPIAGACLEFVTEHPQEFGVWAGLTPDERRNGDPPGARYCRTCSARFNVSVHDPFRKKCSTCVRSEEAKRQRVPVRGSFYCVNGHRQTTANTHVAADGSRKCRRCNSENTAGRRAAAKAGVA